LLFSRQQYEAAADAWLTGLERRIHAGLNPDVPSVASISVSRWDVAANDKVPHVLRNKLGTAVATRVYRAYRSLLESPRWRRAYNFGARPQRLLWASTGTKDPAVADTMYVASLVAPFTVNTMPEATLIAFAEHGRIGPPISLKEELDRELDLIQFALVGVDVSELAVELQQQGANSFVKSWNDLMDVIASKRIELKKAS
jgi:transaldolase